MTPAEPVRSSRRSAQARPPVRAQQDKGKGQADKPPPPPPAPPQPCPPAKKPVVPNQRPPPVPPSSSRPVHPAPHSYAEAARKKAHIQQPAALAAPPSRPPSCKGRRILDYTAHSPSRHQMLINVGDHAKDADLTTLFKDLSANVLLRQGLRVKVLSVEVAYNGYSVPTDKVPSERDTEILRGAVTAHFKTHYKFTPWFQGTHYDLDHLTEWEEVALALKASPIWSSSHILCGDPRVVHTSKASTTATAFFDIWDTASGVAPSGYVLAQRALASPSALGVGSGAIQSVAAMQLPPNVHDALVLTSWRSIAPLQAAAKAIRRRTHLRHLRLVESPALTPLAAQTAERITVPMSALACSGVKGLISFGMSRNIVRMSQTVQDLPVRILSFNCAKSSLSVETILEHFVLAYDIVFIQEPPWRFVRSALSTSRKSGNDVIGAPLHPSWLPMVRNPEPDTRPRVMAYVSNRLKEFRPLMCCDLIDHHDVLILSLFTNGQSYNLMNVYSDETHTAALLLAEEAASLPPFIYMGGDFNIHSQEWDGGHRGHPGAATQLLNTVAELSLQRAFCEPGANLLPPHPRFSLNSD
ncbi:hypothetical protein CVT25_005381 [Psilocybe cyanescens]|uniref:Endonuclease/exonuclease/phosphatase domain-containing protein n=1 Tax=Psilocybe cyanescens TaxID=93625 RepID=A0A409XW38_PSICY|nr:hypothetical protein CVT25_005381 [Psilocybe cyanescens]